MSVVVDLLLILILGYGVWSGYRKGLIKGASRIVAVVIAFYVASIIANTYSGEFVAALKPFVGGMVDSSYTSASEEYKAGIYNDEYRDSENKSEDYIVNMETLKSLGLSPKAAEQLLEDIDTTVNKAEDNVRTKISNGLCARLSYVIVYAIVFFLVLIIFTVIGNVINLAFKLPGLDLINDIGGTVLGFIEALIIVLFIAWFLGYVGILIPETFMEKSIFLKWLMNHNIFISLIS